jgi:hypothetical protein
MNNIDEIATLLPQEQVQTIEIPETEQVQTTKIPESEQVQPTTVQLIDIPGSYPKKVILSEIN